VSNVVARAVRKDLLSEFCMPSNASYMKVASMLIQGRKWLIEHPPKDSEEAQALMVNEHMDREKRLKSVMDLEAA